MGNGAVTGYMLRVTGFKFQGLIQAGGLPAPTLNEKPRNPDPSELQGLEYFVFPCNL